MASTPNDRGQDLLDGARAMRSGPSWLARLWAGRGEALVERINAGLTAGTLHAVLPDGSRRTLGGHAPGFEAQVHLHRWRGLLRNLNVTR